MKYPALALSIFMLPLASFAQEEPAELSAGDKETAVEVTLNMQDGRPVGTTSVIETLNGVIVSSDLSGLPDGTLAMHFHETGLCEDDFSSAGDHFNPHGKDHGFKAENGVHAGDLPNFTVVNGMARVENFNPFVSLTPGEATLTDDDGTAIIIHSGADDYMTQPSGESGDRIACGVVYPGN